jgi:predicted amidohydrolase
VHQLSSSPHWIDCDATVDSNCPADGHYQYNTDVVFDEQGTLVSKYHKSHEFPPFMPTYDQPKKPSYVTYKSSFGVEFGLFICYDIMFDRPAKVLREQGITHFLYAVSQTELGEVVIIAPWSKRNEATVLSSNLGSGVVGDCSGILVNGTDIAGDKIYLNNDKKSVEPNQYNNP